MRITQYTMDVKAGNCAVVVFEAEAGESFGTYPGSKIPRNRIVVLIDGGKAKNAETIYNWLKEYIVVKNAIGFINDEVEGEEGEEIVFYAEEDKEKKKKVQLFAGVDIVVISHFDNDHSGGIFKLLTQKIDIFWHCLIVSPAPENNGGLTAGVFLQTLGNRALHKYRKWGFLNFSEAIKAINDLVQNQYATQ